MTATFDTDGNPLTISGPVSSYGSLDVIDSSGTNSGLLVLSSSIGSATLSTLDDLGGTLEIDNQVSVTGAGGLLVADPAILQGSGTITLDNAAPLIYNSNAMTSDFSGTIAGNGEVELNTGSGILTLGGDNTYTGGTYINSGTLQVGNTSALGALSGGPDAGLVNLTSLNAFLDLNGFTVTVTQLDVGVTSGTAGTIRSYAPATLIVDTSSARLLPRRPTHPTPQSKAPFSSSSREPELYSWARITIIPTER